MAVLFVTGGITIDYSADGWPEFRKWLDGTYAALRYTYVQDAVTYTVAAPDSLVTRTVSFNKGGSDETDFLTNFAPYATRPLMVDAASQATGYVSTSNTTPAAIRATAYTEPSSNAQRSIVSSSASDSAAGVGARTVRVYYLDVTMASIKTEDVTMNGTTPVNLVNSTTCFIERMQVLTVGSNGSNVGTISLQSTTGGGGSTIGSIAPGDAQTNWAHHYVITGESCYVSSINAGCKGQSAGQITLRKATPTVANTPELVIAPQLRVPPGDSRIQPFTPAIPIVGPARIALYAQQDAASGTNTFFAGFGYYET